MNNDVQHHEAERTGRSQGLLVGMLLAILVFGLAITAWRVSLVNQRMLLLLMDEALLVAGTLSSHDLTGLSGRPEDVEHPVYQRIKHQLLTSKPLFPYCRFIYLMKRNEAGQVVFLADSEPADSEDYSPPGQTYDEASADLHRVFETRDPVTEGPMKDRWGVWVSGFVPIMSIDETYSGVVLGMDVDAASWQSSLARYALPPLLFTAVLIVLVVAIHRIRSRALSPPPHRLWKSEAAAVFAFGTTLTVGAAWLAHNHEHWNQHVLFRRLATNQALTLQQHIYRIGDQYLEGLGCFFDSSDFVDRREFRDYTSFLVDRPYALNWWWAPAVTAGDLAAFEESVRASGMTEFRTWERDDAGGHASLTQRDIYYPICYIEPGAPGSDQLGMDVGFSPEFKQVMEQARQSGLTMATQPFAENGSTRLRQMLLMRPVFNRDGSGRLSGFAGATLQLDRILQRALFRDKHTGDPHTLVNLIRLDNETAHQHLLANSDVEAEQRWSAAFHRSNVKEADILASPIFAYGNIFAMIMQPGPAFIAEHPMRQGGWTAVVGLLLTTLLTALTGVLSTRRAQLEHEVSIRTADLQKSEASYRGLFNSIQQSIYIQDREGRFVDINDTAIRQYGYTREELIGKTPEFLSAPGRNNLELVGRCFQRAWSGTPQHFEFWGRRRSGEIFPKDVWLYRGTYFGREVIIALASDISERKNAENERARLHSQLLQSQKMESVGRLAGGVAHDFNNMLQAIIGNAMMAKQETPPGSPVHEYLTEIEESAQRSAALTRQLLAFASKQTIQPKVVDINEVIAGTMKMLRRLIGEEIALQWVPGTGIWPVKIDPGQINQVLANLAVNARDAIKGHGTITISTANYTCDAESCPRRCTKCRPCSYVSLSIRDTGCGMDENTKNHLFEPFFTTKEPGKGTGLGLATVFGIVHQNDGVIEVESAVGQGTTVTIMLPRTTEAILTDQAEHSATSGLGGTETILLVEDEPAVLNLGKTSLGRLGYTVLIAPNPAQAIGIARNTNRAIDLLITDVILPGMNGRELADEIGRIIPGVKCLFMSGYTADVISDRGVLEADTNFIQKPFTIADLARKVRDVLDG